MQPQQQHHQYNAPAQHTRPQYGDYNANRPGDGYMQQAYNQQYNPVPNYNNGGYYYPYQNNAPMYNAPQHQGYDSMRFPPAARRPFNNKAPYGPPRTGGVPNYGPRSGGFPGGQGWGGGYYRRRKKPFVGGSLETQREYEQKTACCFFLQGKCKFAAHCRFIHDEGRTDLLCQFGDNCRVHGTQQPPADVKESDSPAVENYNSEKPIDDSSNTPAAAEAPTS